MCGPNGLLHGLLASEDLGLGLSLRRFPFITLVRIQFVQSAVSHKLTGRVGPVAMRRLAREFREREQVIIVNRPEA